MNSDFYAVLDQVLALLQQRGRVSYRALKRQFDLEDAYLDDLKEEITYAHPQVIDEDGRGLIWTGKQVSASPTPSQGNAGTALPSGAATRALPPEAAQGTPPLSTPMTLSLTGLFPALEAERRQLTVMFCDLVDSTRLSSRLDPEDLREVVRAYQEAAAMVIERFEGYIAQYLGDGLLVYFGYPHAHEDDAQRSIRAGLGIIEVMQPLNTRLKRRTKVRLAVRIGIHTGLVVIGEVGGGQRQEHLALGETPNIAARIQGLAVPDTVVISAATFRLVEQYFVSQDLGVHALKGVAEPVKAYRMLAEKDLETHLDMGHEVDVLSVVGRESETMQLIDSWRQAQAGDGVVVLLSGDAGIGKSRLVDVLRGHVRHDGAKSVTFRCSPSHTQSPLYPVIERLQRFLQWQRDSTPEEKVATIEQMVQTYRFSIEETVPLFATLLSVPLPSHYPALDLSPHKHKHRTQEAIIAWLAREAERQPLLVVWEDLHWADPSTHELLSLLIAQTPTVPLCLLLTSRSSSPLPWEGHERIHHLQLSHLSHSQVEKMLLQITDGKTLPPAVIAHVIAKTDGVPLFIEEMVKMILEADFVQERDGGYELTEPLPTLTIPDTLQGSLMARLDRLPTLKEVAQLAATLGREFTYELLQAVSPWDETTLQYGLNQLVATDLAQQRTQQQRTSYVFKHALVQDVAYQSLLKSTRQRYHQRIAQVLEEHFPDTVAMQPEILAHHYTEASLHVQAITYWHKAGEQALQRSAHAEAISHLRQGLALLAELPTTSERFQLELNLQVTLGPALMAVQGSATPEVEQAYERARALCRQVGETPQLGPVLWGMWRYYQARGTLQTSHELGEHLLTLARHQSPPSLLLAAYQALGQTSYLLGEFVTARDYLEQALRQGPAFAERQHHRTMAVRYGVAPGVYGLTFAALTLWSLGCADQAVQHSQAALALAQQLSHPQSLAVAHYYAGQLHVHRGEAAAIQEHAEALMSLATAQEFSHYVTLAAFLRGAALMAQGKYDAGVTEIRQAMAAALASGAELFWPYWLILLAEGYGKVGQPDMGLAVLAQASAVVEKTEERFYASELPRIQGELLLQQEAPDIQQAETSLQQALAIARSQRARAWELRAVIALSRLWQRQGKSNNALQLLQNTMGWFTEGSTTADLQEAQALLTQFT